ncbi:MAG: wax ester/triacylglycerol synthase family O-acyltransferase, partial [Rhizomicrobium sp.]
MSNSERMTPVDTTWLRMERPANLMVIVGVLVLAGPVDLARLETALADRLLAIPRFRQRTQPQGTGFLWCDDEQFNLSRHIKRARLPGAGDKPELERFVADLASTPLDPQHPRWQFHIVEDYEGGAAVIGRIHHAIGDGIALIGVLLSLTDGHVDPVRRRPRPALYDGDHGFWSDVIGPVMDKVEDGLRLSIRTLRRSLEAAASPAQTLREGTGVASELAYLLTMPNDSPTRFKGVPSGSKRIAWSDPIALPEVKAVSNALGCSVNDMLLAAVAGALNGYLAEKGDETKGVEVRALVPINLRSPGERELGNRFGVVAVELPVGLENPLARVHEIHRRMEALKSSYEPPVTLGLLEALGYAPQRAQDMVFDLLLSRATAVMTNVPGPQQPLFLAGSEIKQAMFWVPQPGNIGMGVSILSFNGHVQFGLITDMALVPDPQAIVARFKPEFEQLLYYVLLETDDDAPSENANFSSAGMLTIRKANRAARRRA